MIDDQSYWSLLPRWIRRFPSDLAVVVALAILTCVVAFTPGLRDTVLSAILGLLVLLFAPGYAFISALFPENRPQGPIRENRTEAEESIGISPQNQRIGALVRVTLSLGMSIVISSNIGILLNYSPWGVRLGPVLISITVFTVLTSGFAARQRWNTPSDNRWTVPLCQWAATARSRLLGVDGRSDKFWSLVFVATVLFAVTSVTFIVTNPHDGEPFTEFYLLSENEQGELVAGEYPTEFTEGESRQLHVGLSNHADRDINYTIIVKLQSVEISNNTVHIGGHQELLRFYPKVDAGSEAVIDHRLTPTMHGAGLRLQYLLYRGEPPSNPTAENAHRELHIWIDVSEPEQARTSVPEIVSRRVTLLDHSGTRSPSRPLLEPPRGRPVFPKMSFVRITS